MNNNWPFKVYSISVQLENGYFNAECGYLPPSKYILTLCEYCFTTGITLEFLITLFKSLFSNALIQSVLYHFIVGVVISVIIGR